MVATQFFLEFSPRNLGKVSNLTNIFRMGWFNHQLEKHSINSRFLDFQVIEAMTQRTIRRSLGWSPVQPLMDRPPVQPLSASLATRWVPEPVMSCNPKIHGGPTGVNNTHPNLTGVPKQTPITASAIGAPPLGGLLVGKLVRSCRMPTVMLLRTGWRMWVG